MDIEAENRLGSVDKAVRRISMSENLISYEAQNMKYVLIIELDVFREKDEKTPFIWQHGGPKGQEASEDELH